MLVLHMVFYALMGVGVYLLGFCFFELSKIHRTLVQRNELAAKANKLAAEANKRI